MLPPAVSPPDARQARELASLEEFRAGDMQKALGRAYLRMDELLVMDNHEAELRKLAGEADHPGPAPGRRWECLGFRVTEKTLFRV